ncbi:hypothetical protein HS5_05120 [Acidianus sp. HS-5]|nr:hypothetical protein HS5_05120 [Acidianus sp. HS-5]
MGHGIAELAAIAGYDVWVNDVNDDILLNARNKIAWSLSKLRKEEALERIHFTTNQEEALKDADFMVEAVVEDLKVKSQVFSKASKLVSENAVLASNTSSIPISEIAKAVDKQERVVGMHFFNPPPLMPLVEIVKGEKTSEETVKVVGEVARKMGKETILVNKDIPGFLVTRIMFRINEVGCWLVDNKVADVKDVDYTAIQVLQFPMGVFLLQDYVGLDVSYLIQKALIERGFELYYCRAFEEKYNSKEFGMKSGKGFYTYDGKIIRPTLENARMVDPSLLVSSAINESYKLIRLGIVSREDVNKGCKLGLSWPKSPEDYLKEFGLSPVIRDLKMLYENTGLPHFIPDESLTRSYS